MRLRIRLGTAVADSALASLATFTVGIYAARALTLEELGAYGVVFAASFILGSSTITQLVYTPFEIELVEEPSRRQLAAMDRTTTVGAAIGLPIALLAVAIAAIVVPDVSTSTRFALATGGVAVAVLSPAQDHVRRVLHQAGSSMAAFSVSAVQLGVAVSVIAAMTTIGIEPVWIPLTALGLANTFSLTVGTVLCAGVASGADAARPPLRDTLDVGRWLVAATQSEQAAGFIAVASLAVIAGSAEAGQFEAARQLAQPLFVLSSGLQAILRPRVIRTTRQGSPKAADRDLLLLVAMLAISAAILAVTIGGDWAWNPLASAIPNAYARDGLLLALLGVSVLIYTMPLIAVQLVALGRQRSLAWIGGTTQFAYLAVAVGLASRLGAMAMPLGALVYVVIWLARARRATRSGPVGVGPASAGPVAAPVTE